MAKKRTVTTTQKPAMADAELLAYGEPYIEKSSADGELDKCALCSPARSFTDVPAHLLRVHREELLVTAGAALARAAAVEVQASPESEKAKPVEPEVLPPSDVNAGAILTQMTLFSVQMLLGEAPVLPELPGDRDPGKKRGDTWRQWNDEAWAKVLERYGAVQGHPLLLLFASTAVLLGQNSEKIRERIEELRKSETGENG